MSKPKFLPKRKSYNTITIDNSKQQVTQSMTHPSLPHYTNVTSKSANNETETPVKVYSKTNYSFPPSFYHRSFSTFLHMTPVGYHSEKSTLTSKINIYRTSFSTLRNKVYIERLSTKYLQNAFLHFYLSNIIP